MNSSTVVLHEDPVPNVLPGAVDRERLPAKRVRNQSRYELLRMLIRAIVVRASSHGHVKPVSDVVGIDKKVRGGFAGRVWTRRAKRVCLVERSFHTAAIDFVCADLLEPNTKSATCLKKNLGSKNVRLNEDSRGLNAAVNMRLGRKIHYRIDFPDKRVRKLAVSDVPFNEPVSLVATKILDVPQVPGICELIEVDHSAVGFVEHVEISTYAVPTKLFEYLACGRPLACTLLHSTVPTLIRQYGVGVVADVDQLTRVLSELNEEEVESMGKKARLVSIQFSVESISKKMKTIIRDLALNSEGEDDSRL